MAYINHHRATIAQENGWFDAEIVPVKTILKDKDGNEKPVTVRGHIMLHDVIVYFFVGVA